MWFAACAFLLQNTAVVPASRMGETWWAERHASAVTATHKGGIDIAFIGDSITQGWDSAGKAIWERDIAPLRAANFGFSGDRTQHVLWRLENGEVIAAQPKVIVIMIGTNNTSSNSPKEISEGITAIVKKLLQETNAKILLLGVFPRGQLPSDPGRLACAETTKLAFQSCSLPRVSTLDIGKHFLRSDGTLRTYLMPDRLHLNANGYEIWAKAILPTLKGLL